MTTTEKLIQALKRLIVQAEMTDDYTTSIGGTLHHSVKKAEEAIAEARTTSQPKRVSPNWLFNAVVKMEVLVSIDFPEEAHLPDQPLDELAKELAMGSITQFHERECGRIGTRIAWAKVYAETSEENCEVIESAE